MQTTLPARRAGLALLAVSAVGSALMFHPSAAAPAQKLPSPSGRITYQMKGSMMNGTAVYSWADGGKKFRQDSNLKVNGPNGQKMDMKGWAMSDGTYFYFYQPMMGSTVRRMKLPKNAPGGPGMGLPMMGSGQVGGKAVGKGNVLGKACEIRQVQGGKVWLWKGIPLKAEMSAPAAPGGPGGGRPAMNMSLVATKVDTAVKPSPSLFKVPAGLKIQDMKAPPGGPSRPGAPRPGARR